MVVEYKDNGLGLYIRYNKRCVVDAIAVSIKCPDERVVGVASALKDDLSFAGLGATPATRASDDAATTLSSLSTDRILARAGSPMREATSAM